MDKDTYVKGLVAMYDWLESPEGRPTGTGGTHQCAEALWAAVARAAGAPDPHEFTEAFLAEDADVDPGYEIAYAGRGEAPAVNLSWLLSKGHQEGDDDEDSDSECDGDDAMTDGGGAVSSEGSEAGGGGDESEEEAEEGVGASLELPEGWRENDPTERCHPLVVDVVPVWRGLAERSPGMDSPVQSRVDSEARARVLKEADVDAAAYGQFPDEDRTMVVPDEHAGIAAAAFLDYMIAEVIELAGCESMMKRHERGGCKDIQPADIIAAVGGDECLAQVWTEQFLARMEKRCRATPRVLLPGGGPCTIDVYWRALDRYPGGNADTFTVRFRLGLPEADAGGVAVRMDWHWCWDGNHSGGGGAASEVAGTLSGTGFAQSIRQALLEMCQEGSFKNGVSTHYLVDTTATDSNSYDTEWSNIEILVFDAEAQSAPAPILIAKRQRILGPQFKPNHMPDHVVAKLTESAPTNAQTGLFRMVADATGMPGKPQQFSDSACPAASLAHSDAMPQFKYGPGPVVVPRYFRW